MRFETVLFDLDGTLIDSGPLILSSFQHATRTVLGREIPDEVLMENVGGYGIQAQMREFDEDLADELVRVYREHNTSVYRRVVSFPGVEPVLESLRSEGRRLGVVTVKGRATVDVTFDVLPLARYFETVVTGDDTERHKPDPQPLLLALERLGASPALSGVRRRFALRHPCGEGGGNGGDRRRLGWHPPAVASRGGGARSRRAVPG